MADLFDTSRVRDQAQFWDELADRVATQAERKSRGSALDWLAQSRSSWVAASLVLASALALLMLSGERAPARPGATWEQALAPTDDMGKAIAMFDTPPAIGALLLRAPGDR
ncbi:MAG TPA: hypothetical protein VGQ52_08765 [Gemmatimonadaceae bacterium]|jgi:hypothetical protein|nr:hypothetical protein [Gemmatimonadaceae bacterium]